MDTARTIFAGGAQTAACQQFDGDPVGCLKGFHGQYGGIASGFHESFGDNCTGCGPGQSGGDCLNTCQHGVPPCTQDPTRLFAGSPCFWDGSCRGCGPNNEGQAECFNTCQAPQ